MRQQCRKIAVIGLVSLLGTGALFAQKRYKRPDNRLEKQHEIMLYFGGGLSTLKYKVTAGKQTDGFGGHIGVGYNFFFSPGLALGTGVEFSLFTASFALDNTGTRFMTTDIENSLFEFRSTMENYKESQNVVMVHIPLMVQIQIGKKHQFYVAAGGKVGLPIRARYDNSATIIQNSGYYEKEDYEYTTQLFMGFGRFTGNSGSLNFKMSFLASAEIGVRWVMKDGYAFYTGIYCDYGLNNIVKQETNSQQFIDFNQAHPSDFTVNSIITSQYYQDNDMQSFTNRIIPLTGGIKLRLAF